MTTKSEHTPGPWVVGGSLIAHENTEIARVLHRNRLNRLQADQSRVAPVLVEADANARLIAAAPELKAQLRALLTAFDAFTREANWGASALSGGTIRQVNEVPSRVRELLARIDGGTE